jgi:2-polyprenyl-3-methyl-5-hydroxy-6-metoxy-1,4-benzoquinol methylase
MSPTRKQLEQWLSTIEVQGRVLDVGGLIWPVKGRTKTWNVSEYAIADIKKSHKGVEADYVVDLNYYCRLLEEKYDVAFCLEVLQFIWNPYYALENISDNMNSGGMLYLSTHFAFPVHKGSDCLRYTKLGISKLLHASGFEIDYIVPMGTTKEKELLEFYKNESKIIHTPEEVGHLIKAIKI